MDVGEGSTVAGNNQDASRSSGRMSPNGDSFASGEEMTDDGRFEAQSEHSPAPPPRPSNVGEGCGLIMNSGSTNNQIYEYLPWIPTMSLLDLAHKLKMAESRVYRMNCNRPDLEEFAVASDYEETNESNLAERRSFSSDEDSRPGHFESTSQSVANHLSSAQKENRSFSIVDVKLEQLSDSNVEDRAFNPSTVEMSSSRLRQSNGGILHKCLWCNFATESKSHLLNHQKAVHQNIITTVVSTTKSMDSLAEADVLQNSGNRSTRRHRCELCNYQTDSKSHLRRHQGSVHSKKKPYKCHLCKMEFARSEKAKEHFMNAHSDEPYDSRKMRKFLPISSKESARPPVDTFTKIKLLYKDLGGDEEEPMNRETKEAKQKPKEVGTENELDGDDEFSLIGLREKSKTRHRGDGSKPYTCLKCDYASRDIWHLKRHISDVHLMRKDYKCKICTYATNRQHRFICHMRTHGEIFCFYCDYSSSKLDVFKQHLQLCSALHKMLTEVQCRLCEMDCKDHTVLKEHMSALHGAVLYSCSICPFYTEVLDDYESHSRIHEEEQRTCNLCSIVFETQQDLFGHRNAVHIGMGEGRLLSCLICQHQELDRTAMHLHISCHTPQVFSCDTEGCSFKAITVRSLVLHSKNHHDKNQPEMIPEPSASSASAPPKISKESPVPKSAALGTYSCPICSERPPFRYRKSFEKHMTQHAVEAESCPLCQDTFFLHKELQEHAFSMHGVKIV